MHFIKKHPKTNVLEISSNIRNLGCLMLFQSITAYYLENGTSSTRRF